MNKYILSIIHKYASLIAIWRWIIKENKDDVERQSKF
jgi:hypothetical protein